MLIFILTHYMAGWHDCDQSFQLVYGASSWLVYYDPVFVKYAIKGLDSLFIWIWGQGELQFLVLFGFGNRSCYFILSKTQNNNNDMWRMI